LYSPDLVTSGPFCSSCYRSCWVLSPLGGIGNCEGYGGLEDGKAGGGKKRILRDFLDAGFGSHSRGELKLGHKFPDVDAPSSSFDELCNC